MFDTTFKEAELFDISDEEDLVGCLAALLDDNNTYKIPYKVRKLIEAAYNVMIDEYY